MIRLMHSPRMDISISDSLAILQSTQNENAMRMGNIFTLFSGFTKGSFVPTLSELTLSNTGRWLVSLSSGKVFFPNGQVITYEQGNINFPILHYGTQYIIISHEMTSMTQGLYATQITPNNDTVYMVGKIRIRSSLGGSSPSLSSNEMIICKIDFSMISDPVITDLRAPYSAYWSIPFSISHENTPVVSILAEQNRNLRQSLLGSRIMNTESIARNDDSITSISFDYPDHPSENIDNGRIEKVRGSSFVWEDLPYDAFKNGGLSSYDFALYGDTYRVSLTDVFQKDLATQWSNTHSPEEATGSPAVSISTVGATAIISATKNSISVLNTTCMIWASENPILINTPPLWIGPLAPATLVRNAGAQLTLTRFATSIYYKVVIIDQYGNEISKITSTHAVSLVWPKPTKMIVLNIMPDMIDETGSPYSHSTDTRLMIGEPFISYLNPSGSTMVITKIIFNSKVVAESTSLFGQIYARPEGGSSILLFTMIDSAEHTYTWEAGEIFVSSGKRLDFEYAGASNRNQGHIILEGYEI